ncbi:unnamed protein product [Closterium sp. NIES-53]
MAAVESAAVVPAPGATAGATASNGPLPSFTQPVVGKAEAPLLALHPAGINAGGGEGGGGGGAVAQHFTGALSAPSAGGAREPAAGSGARAERETSPADADGDADGPASSSPQSSPAASGGTQTQDGGGGDTEDKKNSTAVREEWTDEATDAVLEVWARKHLSLSRGKLKKHEWEEVAQRVSEMLGHANAKTWLQCKNKIDSIKKKYKAVRCQLAAGGSVKREWRLYDRVDYLLGGGSASHATGSMGRPAPIGSASLFSTVGATSSNGRMPGGAFGAVYGNAAISGGMSGGMGGVIGGGMVNGLPGVMGGGMGSLMGAAMGNNGLVSAAVAAANVALGTNAALGSSRVFPGKMGSIAGDNVVTEASDDDDDDDDEEEDDDDDEGDGANGGTSAQGNRGGAAAAAGGNSAVNPPLLQDSLMKQRRSFSLPLDPRMQHLMGKTVASPGGGMGPGGMMGGMPMAPGGMMAALGSPISAGLGASPHQHAQHAQAYGMAAAGGIGAGGVNGGASGNFTSPGGASGPGGLANGTLRPSAAKLKRKASSAAVKDLALAVREFASVYERVERAKVEQMVEMERLRLEFSREMEVRRMKVQLEVARLAGGGGGSGSGAGAGGGGGVGAGSMSAAAAAAAVELSGGADGGIAGMVGTGSVLPPGSLQ